MLSEQDTGSAAGHILQHWREGTQCPALPSELAPSTRAEGYAIQAQLGQDVAGWKIAATSRAGQKHINVSGPIAGRLFRERVHASGAEVSLGAYHMAVAEAEFAFRMGSALEPRTAPYTQQEVLGAVDALHPAIELPDSRFDDFTLVGEAQLIADNACAHEFAIGEATSYDWRSLDLSAHTVVATAGNHTENGLGERVLGGPLIALTWLANELSALRITLEVGHLVTTGTCITPLPIASGDRVTGDFGVLGSVEVALT